jgi:hypothetical protein
LNFWDFYNSQSNKSKLGKQEKANNVTLFLNCFYMIMFLKMKYFYTKNTMKNKEFLEINLSQFGVWKHSQMIYLLFTFNCSVINLLSGLIDWA